MATFFFIIVLPIIIAALIGVIASGVVLVRRHRGLDSEAHPPLTS